jgi:hypothetical protein
MKIPHGVKSTPRPFWRCFAWRPSRMVKGAAETGKLSIIFHFQRVFLSKAIILWAYSSTEMYVKD